MISSLRFGDDLVTKVGDNLGILPICVGYSTNFKAFGILTNRKWSFMTPFSGKV